MATGLPPWVSNVTPSGVAMTSGAGGETTAAVKVADAKLVSRNSNKYDAAVSGGFDVPNKVASEIAPAVHTASRSDGLQLMFSPRSQKGTELRAGALVGLNCTVMESSLTLAGTFAAGVIGHTTPVGFHVPALPAERVRVNDVIELLNSLPNDPVSPVDRLLRSKVTDQLNTSPVTIDVPTVDVAVAVPLTTRVVLATVSVGVAKTKTAARKRAKETGKFLETTGESFADD